jgi:recombination protein RecT
MTDNLAIQKIESHLLSPQVMAKFVGVLDKSAMPYIRSVMIAVEADMNLQKCTPESVGISALRAASLQLSCDPAVKQAYLLPYWNNKKKTYEAQFQPHYLGLYALAVRTNKYSVINVTPFPAGYSMELDLSSGDYVIVNEDGKPVVFAPKVRPQDAGAWYGYLRTTRNFSKKIWMSKAEIHEHARKFNSKGYNADGSLWKNPNQVHTMEMKTVLRELLNWADKSGYGDNTLREALKTDEAPEAEVIDAKFEDTPDAEGVETTPAPATEAPAAAQEPETATEEPKYSYNSDKVINVVKKITSFSTQEAAATMSEAMKKNMVQKELTISEAEAFARSLVTPV